ncbi:major facilitator superfamily domain-containing protein [Scheffersomyces amazonensis]|uniref:major facilitator superfamily domain-containing protein n=1 Tax=Scheffersomyces amazonensis TaxID=1078765 RepID=UPI00315DD643
MSEEVHSIHSLSAYDDDKLQKSLELNGVESQVEIEPPYTIFNQHEKYILILILSFVGFWSTVSSPIYFPALPTLTAYFHTTPAIMNLSIVAYLLFQGIAPTVASNLADNFGKRPVIIASIIIYVASCVAISQTNVYWLLAVLRCIQAAGIAPVIAISSGVAGDVCTAADRGGFVGVVAGFQLVGNGLGGLLGAVLISSFNSWRAIFIFLAIGAGVTFIFCLFCLPETARNIVGNGSVIPKNFFNKSAMIYLPHFRRKLNNETSTISEQTAFDFWSPFRIFFKPDVFFTLFPVGMQFAAWTMVLASISTELESSAYNYSVLKVGLIYLPQGIACLLGSMVIGKVLNVYYTYRRNKYEEKYKDTIERPPFNIVKTRLDICIFPAAMMIIGLLIFGWCLQYRKNISSIIISTILIAFSSSAFISACTTMLVDLYPGKGSASTSCLNLMRCWLAALGSGVLDKMISSMGLGGCYTLVAGLCLLADLSLFYVVHSIGNRIKHSVPVSPVASD